MLRCHAGVRDRQSHVPGLWCHERMLRTSRHAGVRDQRDKCRRVCGVHGNQRLCEQERNAGLRHRRQQVRRLSHGCSVLGRHSDLRDGHAHVPRLRG